MLQHTHKLVIACLAVFAFQVAFGDRLVFSNTLLIPGEVHFGWTDMFSPEDAPAHTPPGNGQSYVRFAVTLSRPQEDAEYEQVVQFLVFHKDYLPLIGYQLDPQSPDRHYCCTQRVLDASANFTIPGCSSPNDLNKVIVAATTAQKISVHTVVMKAGETSKKLTKEAATHPITRSGMYYRLMSNCQQAGSVYVNGDIVYMNPYGYLPGRLYGYLPFYGVITICYLVVGFVWFVLCLMHWREIIRLQNLISVVIFLGMLETTLFYFYHLSFNNTGVRSSGPAVVGTIARVLKKAVSRMLVLVVAMGYGVLRPSLGQTAYKVAVLGICYIIFSMLLDILTQLRSTTDISPILHTFAIIPVALIDSAFYWWIFFSLSKNLQYLENRRQLIKLELYKRFTRILVGSIAITCLSILCQMYIMVTHNVEANWHKLWVFEAYWDVLYFGILVAIMILWRPSQNSQRYAYSEELPQADDEPAVPMSTIGGMAIRSGGGEGSSGRKAANAFEIGSDEDDDGKLN
eukprot:GFYU01005731.1.p1 GENE.GFYU01005731.1~~GFYU01005731.1.p1  ORF type:complete len:515 (+),score=109.61 GFYU01005731.1:170-1714(+)